MCVVVDGVDMSQNIVGLFLQLTYAPARRIGFGHVPVAERRRSCGPRAVQAWAGAGQRLIRVIPRATGGLFRVIDLLLVSEWLEEFPGADKRAGELHEGEVQVGAAFVAGAQPFVLV